MQLALVIAVVAGAVAWMASPAKIAPGAPHSLASKMEEWPDEHALGDPAAPVQVVEYHSLTCNHCAHFDLTTLPAIKTDYIETGKVRYIARAFPLNAIDVSAFLVARCLPHEQYFDAVHLIYTKLETWAFASQEPDVIMNNLADVMKETGMNRATFEQCLGDGAKLERMSKEQFDAQQRFRVNSTPTFVINGEVQNGDMTIEAFRKIVDPLVAAAKK